jgi:hypothetical protein
VKREIEKLAKVHLFPFSIENFENSDVLCSISLFFPQAQAQVTGVV